MEKILVVGPRRAQNELLAAFLKSSLSLAENSIRTVNEEEPQHLEKGLVLYDCSCRDQPTLEVEARRMLERLPRGGALALFNVIRNEGLEQNLVTMGVRGVFFESDPPEVLQKGTAALLEGEVWASRKTLSECLGKTITHVAAERGDGDVLSPREKEVLLFIARGKSDNEIAGELCISPFTVKTHLYRIFRKVSVTNRLQAALWAVKHL